MIKISEAEYKVMEIIWAEKEITSNEIIKKLGDCKWNDNTIRTLINRLTTKKAIGISKKEGKTYTYVPLIKENDYKIKNSKRFLSQFYNGSVGDMLLNFMENHEVSRSELEFLMDKIEKELK